MTNFSNDYLEKIWNKVIGRGGELGKPGNWAAVEHKDIDTLRYADEDRLWARRSGGKTWVEVPGMG